MRTLSLLAALSIVLGATGARAQGRPPQPDLPRVNLDDDAPASIGLDDAVRLALARNPTAVVALEEVRRATAIVQETRSAALPTLYGNGTYTQLDAPRPIAEIPARSVNLAATLTVPLVVPKPWAQWSQSADEVVVSRMSYQDTRRAVAVSVARAYLTIVAQKRVIEAAVRARDTDEAHYAYAKQRHDAGAGTGIDEVRARQQVESDVSNVEQQLVVLARAREALGVLVGVGGPLDAREGDLPAPTDREQALHDAESRPDVLAAEAHLRAAEHAVRDGWTDYSPSLVGSFMPFYQNPPLPTAPETGWQAQLLLTVPLYDGGLRYGQESERKLTQQEARTNLDAVSRQARSDVRVAFEEIKRADAALVSARSAARLAETALQMANTAYRAGAYTNLEVIDAERTARDAATAVAVAEDGARQARLDALSASGRFP